MGDDKENLRKYNTEAFVVPEEEKMGNNRGMGDNTETDKSASGNGTGNGISTSGNSVGDSVSASGNDAQNGINISGNGPVGRGEGLEGGSGPKVGSEGGLNEKAPETAKNSRRNENGDNYQNVFAKPLQKHQKRMSGIAVAVIVVTLAIAGVAGVLVWDALRQSTQEPVETDKPVVSDDGKGGEKPNGPEEPEEPEIKEISIEEPVVQELYEKFRLYPSMCGFGFLSFYEGVNDEENRDYMMINKAIYEIEPLEKCQKQYSEYGMEKCYDAKEVSRKTKELFGREIVGPAEGKLVYSTCGSYTVYSEDVQEYAVPVGCGGSCGGTGLSRWLYRAETKDDELYLYDLAVVASAIYTDMGEYTGETLYYRTEDNRDENWQFKDGALIDLGLGENEVLLSAGAPVPEGKVAVELDRVADKLDMYKWTFRKNEEGNYVFAGLEKVQ